MARGYRPSELDKNTLIPHQARPYIPEEFENLGSRGCWSWASARPARRCAQLSTSIFGPGVGGCRTQFTPQAGTFWMFVSCDPIRIEVENASDIHQVQPSRLLEQVTKPSSSHRQLLQATLSTIMSLINKILGRDKQGWCVLGMLRP